MEDQHFARRCFLVWFAENCPPETNNGVKTRAADCAQKACGQPFLHRPRVHTQPTSCAKRTSSLIRIVPGTGPSQLAASFNSNQTYNVGYWHKADNPIASKFV